MKLTFFFKKNNCTECRCLSHDTDGLGLISAIKASLKQICEEDGTNRTWVCRRRSLLANRGHVLTEMSHINQRDASKYCCVASEFV